jgi:hypothetical protein
MYNNEGGALGWAKSRAFGPSTHRQEFLPRPSQTSGPDCRPLAAGYFS